MIPTASEDDEISSRPAALEPSTAFSIEATEHPPDAMILRLVGELDLATAPVADRAARQCLQATTSALIIDLAGLSFCDAAGLGVFVGLQREAEHRRRHLTLRHPNAMLRRILQLTGLVNTLRVEP